MIYNFYVFTIYSILQPNHAITRVAYVVKTRSFRAPCMLKLSFISQNSKFDPNENFPYPGFKMGAEFKTIFRQKKFLKINFLHPIWLTFLNAPSFMPDFWELVSSLKRLTIKAKCD